MRVFFYNTAVAILALGGGAAIASAQTSATSGLQGTVLFAPIRPGPTTKDAPRSAPAGNLEFVVKRGDTKIASFTTDAEGHFQVALPAGHYVITREDPGSKIGHWTFEADVMAGQVTSVTWTGDSGMR